MQLGVMERGSSKICTGAHKGEGVSHLISFHVFVLWCLCFICTNLTLPSFKKDVFVRSGYFSPMRSISVAMKLVFSNFKLFFQTKVSQIAFNFNQLEFEIY